MGEVLRSTKIIMFASSDLKCEIYLIQMLNILKKMLEIRKYYTQAGNVINILSGEHQHNVNSLAFLSLFGYQADWARGARWHRINNNLLFSSLFFYQTLNVAKVFVVHNKWFWN